MIESSNPKPLPVATSPRWKPLRGGFLNIYRYDRQEFWYEDGRLLLRGNNGSGKSRVLALQLPFLLDGEIHPSRVEPDQDPAKRMEWNLLMGGKYDDRLGYTWLEFGRVDEDGRALYQTIGCGLRAVKGRGIAHQWFFITPLRIGSELPLENEQGQPLSKIKLEECLQGKGRVFGSGKLEHDRQEYRRAVDATLFGLGERYEALLSLLIQLRQPQLSRKLDEKVLSDALSLALPPLPPQVLEDVAEAFRGLETEREELANLTAASKSSELFLTDYRRYIRIAARRRAEDVRKAHSAYEGAMRRQREAEARVEQAAREIEELKQVCQRLAEECKSAEAAERTLRESPEMKSARDLETARSEAEASGKNLRDAASDEEGARSALRQVEEEQQTVALKVEQLEGKVAQQLLEAEVLAAKWALGEPHGAAAEQMNFPHGGTQPCDAARISLVKAIEWRQKGIQHLSTLSVQVDAARQQMLSAQQAKEFVENELITGIEEESKALTALQESRTAFIVAYRTWASALTRFSAPDFEEMEEAFADWCELPHQDNPFALAVRTAGHSALGHLQRAVEQNKIERERIHEAREAHRTTYQQLQDGQESPPPASYTCNPLGRAPRAGAPFWALCDFQSGLTETQKSGLEAALESSGLLDAWVSPNGTISLADREDSFLVTTSSPLAPEGQRLDLALRPDDSAPGNVPASTVSRLLQHLGFGPGAGMFWVACEGNWQLGPLHGHWEKPAAQYIGHTSREAERQRRMQEIVAEIEELNRQHDAVCSTLAALGTQIEQCQQEMTSLPADSGIRSAVMRLDAARKTVASKRSRLTDAEKLLSEKRSHWNHEVTGRMESARDFKLTEWVEKLQTLKDGLQEYSLQLAALWPDVAAYFEGIAAQRQINERHQAAESHHAQREARKREFAEQEAMARARYTTLQSTLGKSVEDIHRRLQEATSRVARLRAEAEEKNSLRAERTASHAVATNDVNHCTDEVQRREKERSGHLAGLIGFAGTGQLRIVHEELAAYEQGLASTTRVVELAREIEALLEEVDHSEAAWNRNQKEIHQHFETLQINLRSHGYLPEASISDGVFVVIVPFQGRSCTVAELRDNLTVDIQGRLQLLDAKEQEVLENYLIDEVANHLHDLLHRALHWQEEANQELESRPMHTGMTLRFAWEPASDAPPALLEARRLLLGARGTWSPAQREAVGKFLQQRIRAAQMNNDTGTWQDHLAEAFDYRKWHQFFVERRQDNQWKRLTRRTHGTGSGGEKAIALTLPQLAAAAAHYRSASPHAPRLILLDEAFVGVDKDMRAKCLDLLCAFDLDVVMTSESEWACYPTVPAIAIYQLSARSGIDAVYASRWVWNGRQRLRDDHAPGGLPA